MKLDKLDATKEKLDNLDELDAVTVPNPRCKICRSPYLHEINRMLIEGKPYSEIIAKFPDLNLNKQNISNHKKHFNFIRRGIEKYYQQLEEGADKIVDTIKILDDVIMRSYVFLAETNPKEKPRVWEVLTNAIYRAASLKHKIMGDYDEEEGLLEEIFGKAEDIEEK